MKTIKITNIKYDGHDFCGELSFEESSKVISEQPTDFEFQYDEKVYAQYPDMTIVDIVDDYFYEKNMLTPTSFDLVD
jgi:hypothetical protein